MMKRLVLMAVAFWPFTINGQQTADKEFLGEDLQSLLNTPVAVASVKELTLTESPAIITVITREDISRFGLRYLSDISRLVPGIAFGCDVLGVVGMGVRNNWAHEGKVLLMLDGIEWHEELYATLQFGNHYSLDNIEKIEIIRGPGSVRYGGTASLMVINLISAKNENTSFLSLRGHLSTMGSTPAERGGSVTVASGNSRSGFMLNSRFSRDIRSNQTYTDVFGNSYEMKGSSGIENTFLHLIATHDQWNFKCMFDDYRLQSRDGYQEISEQAYPVYFQNMIARLDKKLTLSSFEWRPYVQYKRQAPWTVDYPNNEIMPDEIIYFNRLEAGSQCVYSVHDYHSLEAGVTFMSESAFTPPHGVAYFSEQGGRFNNENVAFFLQSLSRLGRWTLAPGVRFNYNSRYQHSWVPRIALARSWQKLYAKTMVSRSFRTPSIMNIHANPYIRPEYATVMELEAGYAFLPFSVLSANVYRMVVEDPITYFYDDVNQSDGYVNDGRAGTKGIELSFSHHFPASKLALNASFSRPVSTYSHDLHQIPGSRSHLLGFAPFTANVNYSCNLWRWMTLWAATSYASRSYGIDRLNSQGEPVLKQYPPQVLFHTGLHFFLNRSKQWKVSLMVNNVLNTDQRYIQPYRSLHAPLPGKGREWLLSLTYELNKRSSN
jgi:outer membrane cobalamin receptor